MSRPNLDNPLIAVLSETGLAVAEKIAGCMGGQTVAPEGRADGASQHAERIGDAIAEAFSAGRPVIGIMAAGSLIRILAPHLSDKQKEPPVIAVAEDGSSAVPLLGGHRGANDLARKIAVALQGHAAITTAGDLRFGIALDAPPDGWALADPQNAKPVMAALLAGEQARLAGACSWLEKADLPVSDEGSVQLIASDRPQACGPLDLHYVPKTCVLGMGCERGCDRQEAIALAVETLGISNVAPQAVAMVASIDVKADEAAIHAVAGHFGVPARFFSADTLETETPRLATPSDIVFAEVGCHGVAEGAALAAAGEGAELVQPKRKSKRATAAIARSGHVFTEATMKKTGRQRGRLFVVGIGPGQEGWRSPEVARMIGAASDLVGYSLYLDLIGDISGGKTRHDFDLGKEEDRVRHAMELAGTGKDVALVCSGDAGIYAMATLVFELLAKGGLTDAAQRIGIEVSPGISALQAAAARAGAPLGHDFCTISLSDLLTPWEAIQMRVKAAAEGDFVISFYNPVSKRRRTQLAYARDVLLEHRPADTPVILATNLGRPEEKVRVVPLSELQVDDVDMLTVVIVGSSETRTICTGDGRNWVYTPRGYAAKQGTGIGA
ncbi:precorrin-3B C(17)-methyltransferase [Salaquimonas pukyongi]|uniref:precorrin-3B C(17)-methyltransferase n=1 Tax=Salaquimonas pukyongi TaxID=2712698 RepID=UPI00096B7DB7|nr:precorrin-3B C(17)-methyltransferase [Salaquimonas pukyongi]